MSTFEVEEVGVIGIRSVVDAACDFLTQLNKPWSFSSIAWRLRAASPRVADIVSLARLSCLQTHTRHSTTLWSASAPSSPHRCP